MPRKSRIDAPGALNHVIARGIDRTKIFQDPADKRNFLERSGEILKATDTRCCAWALIPNHFHLLRRSGQASVTRAMRRLLTGYALWYNRRYRRRGHLFQTSFVTGIIFCLTPTLNLTRRVFSFILNHTGIDIIGWNTGVFPVTTGSIYLPENTCYSAIGTDSCGTNRIIGRYMTSSKNPPRSNG